MAVSPALSKTLFRTISSAPRRPTIWPRIVVFHSNAGPNSSNGYSLRNYIETQLRAGNTGVTQPQGQIDLDGTEHRFLPLDAQPVLNAYANPFSIGWETQDYGSATLNTSPWTDAQIETMAEACVAAHRAFGIPLLRANAWDGAGIGYHAMWGVNTTLHPKRNPWTTQKGKTCPGTARSAQLDTIIWRANELLNPKPKLALTKEQILAIRQATKPTIRPFDGAPGNNEHLGFLVTYVQIMLSVVASQPVGVSGVYDGATYNGVIAIQTLFGLVRDGIVGQQTWPAFDTLADQLLPQL